MCKFDNYQFEKHINNKDTNKDLKKQQQHITSKHENLLDNKQGKQSKY